MDYEIGPRRLAGTRNSVRFGVGQCRSVQAQQEICNAGAENSQLIVSVSGIACRYKIMGDGGRAIVGFILPGDFSTPVVSEPV